MLHKFITRFFTETNSVLLIGLQHAETLRYKLQSDISKRVAWQKSLQAVWQKWQKSSFLPFLPTVLPVATVSGRLSAVMGLPGIDLTHSFAGVLGDAVTRPFRLPACPALSSQVTWLLLLLLLPKMRLRSATFGTGAK